MLIHLEFAIGDQPMMKRLVYERGNLSVSIFLDELGFNKLRDTAIFTFGLLGLSGEGKVSDEAD